VAKPAADDWRRQGQERWLAGVRLIGRPYRLYRPGWDHDHCSFCWAKFSFYPGDLTWGYATEDDYHWICSCCFEDFKEEFRWQVLPPQST
jgi:hypothetical protein